MSFSENFKRFRKIGILNTLYFNFRYLPISQAYKLPIVLGHRIVLEGLHRKGIVINTNSGNYKFGMISLGISAAQMYPDKMLYTMIRMSGGGKIVFNCGEGRIRFYSGCRLLACNGGILSIGSDCIFNQNVLLCCYNRVSIGDRCNVGWDCQIYDTDFHLVYNEETRSIKSPLGTVTIGNNTWFGNRVTVAKNSFLPPFSIVTSNSLVNKNFSHFTSKGNLFAGTPAVHRTSNLYRLRDIRYQQKMIKFFMETGEKSFQVDDQYDFMKYTGLLNE